MAVLSISSQVAQGHVGNSATAFAMRRLGRDVWDLPTVVLSHHPGHAKPAGMAMPPETVRAMIESVLARGRPEALFSGYLANAENAVTIAAVARRLRLTGHLPYVLDPVLGDAHTGLYVGEDVASGVRDTLLPLADIVLPNRFELAFLTGREITSVEDCTAACRQLIAEGPRAVICTSSPAPARKVSAQIVTTDSVWRVSMPEVPDAPHGTGDLFAGVVLAKSLDGMPIHEAAGYGAGAVHAVAAWSKAMGLDDLALVPAQASIGDPPVLPEIETLSSNN
ncbi:MAG: pyridoxal kinase [Minwuia sp.]|uniref:pyridoxal kinase n=1 Tax=Minwuia sp. TaxID=2493630 RepID=UPI003A89FF9C